MACYQSNDNHQRLSAWLDQHIWPQIQSMMLNDAYFKLIRRARELTGGFNGPVAGLIEVGYVVSQTVTIRRLCDGRRDVISLRRLLIEAQSNIIASRSLVDELLLKLDRCDHVCDLVNNYVAHTANSLRKSNLADWNLQVGHLIDSQRAICEVSATLDRDVLRRKNYVRIVPVPQFDIMGEFRLWVPEEGVTRLWEFWHSHNESVNAWIAPAL